MASKRVYAPSGESPKTDSVKDFIHDQIGYSRFEKHIISTDIFNRLHGVLQNSTLYLTFPSNRTSRFSHSLGVMHLAGELFSWGTTNATDEARHSFLSQAATLIEDEMKLLGEGIGTETVQVLRGRIADCRYYPKLTQGYYPEIDPPPTLAEGRIANGIVDVI